MIITTKFNIGDRVEYDMLDETVCRSNITKIDIDITDNIIITTYFLGKNELPITEEQLRPVTYEN